MRGDPSDWTGNFFTLYPQTTAGSMIRWAWGVSRLIDALQEHPEAGIDTTRLAISGCSFAGKIACTQGHSTSGLH